LREENRDWENELKDFTHIRSGNDIRGACGSPCFQCQKDLVLRELISRIESAAYKKGKEEVTKLYAENHLMVKNHNDTPIDIDATIDNARADEREIVAREAIKIAIDSENLTEELERLKALQSLLPKENQGE
jgi:leucyl aminopeptidase (aminopeptidase T)